MIQRVDFSNVPGFPLELPAVRIYQPANHGSDIVVATASGEATIPLLRVMGVSVRARSAIHTDLTCIEVFAGNNKNQTLIDSVTGDQSGFSETGTQVGWDGGASGAVLANGEDVTVVLTGTGATYVDFDICVRYALIQPAASLS